MNIKTINAYFLKKSVPIERDTTSKRRFREILAKKLKLNYPGLNDRALFVIINIITNKVFLNLEYSGKIKAIVGKIYKDLSNE